MFLQRSKFPAQALAAIFFASLAAVAAALVAQHAFGVKPCPWCVMQRGVFLLIAAVAGLTWVLKGVRPVRSAGLILIMVLGLAGVAAAAFQHQVASKLASCDMTLADRLLSALDLENLLPSVFMVTASCSEAAAYRLIGLPYELWSGLLFVAIAVASLVAVKKR
ncbi:disulfide bond formation protein B [Roseateles sp.]|uniref:disulfide bond formation protein B n=1 Tax=Roseateles sp. TaxID=1971397 RepID=UPI00286BA741|nr:disulfide bond formation protein B [Roseateles sp.]